MRGCGDWCPEGQRYAQGSIYCVLYGMIIREGYTCRMCRKEGGEKSEDGDQDIGGEDGTEIQGIGGNAAGTVPGVL